MNLIPLQTLNNSFTVKYKYIPRLHACSRPKWKKMTSFRSDIHVSVHSDSWFKLIEAELHLFPLKFHHQILHQGLRPEFQYDGWNMRTTREIEEISWSNIFEVYILQNRQRRTVVQQNRRLPASIGKPGDPSKVLTGLEFYRGNCRRERTKCRGLLLQQRQFFAA